MIKELSVRTSSRVELLDITNLVQEAVSKSGVKSGLCCVFIPHTTAGITINENADPSVRKDIIKELNKIIPFEDNYSHLEGNAAAHIKASLVGFSQNIFFEEKRLILGTWQGIYFCEFDGPRSRRVYVKIIAD
ncbi:MAG: secondary thiamine-phosphate synthase enzyme YjbQ [candidate division Zixibacteria bacterium]|nr:secondary thiamine-phosphate synthase enzyme YjbQ [candidate division Zixibacteria bacterium]